MIDKRFLAAAAFAAAGAVLTFFGFMHGKSVAVTPTVAAAYTVVAVLLLALGRVSTAPETAGAPSHAAAAPAPRSSRGTG